MLHSCRKFSSSVTAQEKERRVRRVEEREAVHMAKPQEAQQER